MNVIVAIQTSQQQNTFFLLEI
ncbi:hypothetical protein CGLO_05473 [Colletotrichum gloeosporioides Cg-14]|uniref:Uncharacterized protein n=1 Tax=Colletotrichum gloeosporioides (strain Cg-14) TaxID=1237896 RepID=T0LSG9_COLGC|nr:hypothetical protein CGLO_05473 [Colletotrichum gloeosporioides Cg-14]